MPIESRQQERAGRRASSSPRTPATRAHLSHLAPIIISWLAVVLSGCMTWTPGWQTSLTPAEPSPSELEPQILVAQEAFLGAGTEASLDLARSETLAALSMDSSDKRALRLAAEIEILQGAAYDQNRRAKAESYRRGIEFAERAMATHPEFARQARQDGSIAEAVTFLGPEYGEEMLLWVTGVSYYFKECLSGLGHLLNYRWMLRTSEVMSHLDEVAPELQHGAVPFSLGIYYIGLPPSAGGDIDRATELLETAVSKSGTSLLPRWGRAKYLHVKKGDEAGFRSDLQWVLSQDPEDADSPYPWNVYFQRDAREMLDHPERLF